MYYGRYNMFDKYKNTHDGFEAFNKLVINMPRHAFGSMNIDFVKELAMILSNIEVSDERLTIVHLYYLIHNLFITKPSVCEITPRFILQLFDFSLITEDEVKKYYNSNDGKARNFRHLVEIMRLWGLLDDSKELSNIINYKVCDEFFKLDSKEIEGLRSRMMGMDIMDNSFFISVNSISTKIRNKTIFSYKPATAILTYMKEINRAVSKFEIANLLGIITPECVSSQEIMDNALKLGKSFPENIKEHQKYFFNYMNWIDENGKQFVYKNSQAPHFKFNSFMLFMENVGLVKMTSDNEAFVLTEYSEALLKENIPIEIVELERYIDIAENAHSDKDLADLIIYNIKPSLLCYAAQNEKFINAMNKRSLTHPKRDNRGKKIRSKLIAELSKIRANYTCQVSGLPTFKDSKGNNYVESHHIIEFNGEDGPDIIDNLLVISPLYHSLIHHAGSEDLYDFYDTLRKKNIINIDLFKNMIDNYNCLEEKHIRSLYNKHLITKIEYNELTKYINNKLVQL